MLYNCVADTSYGMKTLKDADIKNKTILLRVDFNVTVEDSRVTEDFRMRASLPTIRYLIEKEAKKIIIISHFGRPNGERDSNCSLRPVAEHLSQLLSLPVEFMEGDFRGEVKLQIEQSDKQIIFLENLRFYSV